MIRKAVTRLEGKLDLVLSSVQAGRDETRESRRSIIANIWVFFGAVVVCLFGLLAVVSAGADARRPHGTAQTATPSCLLSQPTLGGTTYTESAAANSTVSSIGGAALTGCSGTVNIALSGANASQFALSSATMPSSLTCPTGTTCNAGAGPQAITLTASYGPATNTPQAQSFSMTGVAAGAITFQNITVDPGQNIMLFAASGSSGTKIGNVWVATSDGSAFSGTIASSDGRFAVNGCPTACELDTNTTGLATATAFPLTLTASQGGVTTSAAYPFTPVSDNGSTQTLEGIWANTGDAVPGGTWANGTGGLAVLTFVVQATPFVGGFSAWNQGAAGTVTITGADGSSFSVGSQTDLQIYSVYPTIQLATSHTYHYTIHLAQSNLTPSTMDIPITLTTGPAASQDTALSNSSFPNFVKFQSNSESSTGTCANQALFAGMPSPSHSGPFFFAFFRRPEDFDLFGMQVSWGPQDNRDFGLNGWSFSNGSDGHSSGMFEWFYNSYNGNIIAPPVTLLSSAGDNILGQWQMQAVSVLDQNTRRIWSDGAYGHDSGTPMKWPSGDQAITLGSYFNTFPYPTPGSAVLRTFQHTQNESYNNFAVVLGVPTPTELEMMRNNPGAAAFASGSPEAIWGSRVWAHWMFQTVNPQASPFLEPDVSGNARPLSYYDGGTSSGHSLPTLYNSSTAPSGIAPSTATTVPACGP